MTFVRHLRVPKKKTQTVISWQAIPIHIRRTLYILPLFIQWWPALYFEKDVRAQQIARYALGLFLLFLVGTLLSYLFYILAPFLPSSAQLHFYYLAFYLQMLWNLSYICMSMFIAYNASRGKIVCFLTDKITLPYKVVNAIERLFQL